MSESKAASDVSAIDELASTGAPLQRARHAPGYVYTAPEVLAREKDKLFMTDWLFVGRVEEFDRPGDYRAFRVLGEPIAVSRSKDGQLHAFANVCRHRGVEVVTGEGNAETFSCPYHGWSYDLTGRLLAAPYTQDVEGFDVRNCRMTPLRIGTWAGNVFVCFDPGTPPLDEFLGEFAREFDFLRMDRCRLSAKLTIPFNCNWKFIVENLMDYYHVGVLHVRSFGAKTFFDRARFTLLGNGGMRFDYASAPSTPMGTSLFGNLPWLADQPESFAVTGYLAPNFQLFGRSDQVRLYSTWPVTPGRCDVVHYSLFPAEHFQQPDFALKANVYHRFIESVVAEDRSMVESLHNGVASRVYEPGPMTKLEQAIHHVLNNILKRISANGA